VGRRDEQAFAYFLYPAEYPLSRETQERLEAIAEFTELGSGYQLSLRDLQIRGGGEILGLSQHGHGDKVGLYLYYKLLEEAILKARGEAAQKVAFVEVKLPLGIPPSYIPQDSVRVALYRRLLKADSGPEVDELAREIGDRFGPPPEAVRLLLACARLRAQLHLVGVEYARCTWDETLVTGEAEGLKSLVSGLPGWVVQGSKAIGPGGPRAVVALASRLEVLSAEGTPGR
jgi:transcription-repair coupling factor (superfamily II helicase)